MSESKNCPNCQEELKSGILSDVKLLDDNQVSIINEYHEPKKESYCNKCGNELYKKYKSQLLSEKEKLSEDLQNLIHELPVISTHTPLNWDYEILDMVTGQSATGTGVISEFTSTFTDLIGSQSDRHSQKLKEGENLCFAQIRKQTLDLGGNAVIATDIDYSEIGAGKGMLMVCMAGTSVKLKNTDILGNERAEKIKKLYSINERYQYLESFEIDVVQSFDY